jgi:Aldo/keto reductase family
MRYRQLGSSDLQVSEISLGSWLTYGVGVENDAARACLDRAFELGMNLIDTSNVYGRGAAEEFLGDALKDRPRDSYVLATKLFFPMDDTGENQGLSRGQVFKQIDDSLRRLRTDYVDLYQCHRYDPETPLEETMEALSEVVRQGKVRYLGFSEWTPQQIQASLDLSPPDEKFVSSQPLACDRARGDPALLGQRDLADRLVSARSGRADRQVQARRAAARRYADGERDGVGDGSLPLGRRSRGGSAAAPDRRRPRDHDGAARSRVGAT